MPTRIEKEIEKLDDHLAHVKGEQMKVVINTCFGGFSLSSEAIKRLIEIESSGVSTLTQEKYCGSSLSMERFQGNLKDVGDGYQVGFCEDILYKDGLVYFYEDENRTDPKLVQVIEEMGEAANGSCSSLSIVEIPDDVQWYIEEYDGSEHIAENHRTWR